MPRQLRPLVGRYLLVALPPEQHDLVARGHRGVLAAVDHDLVHGDRPGQGAAPSTDEDAAATREQRPRHAVGVADRNGCHHRASRQGPHATVGGRSPASSVRTETTRARNDMAGRSVSPPDAAENAAGTAAPGR